ncbi:amino acid adenylation domain-containing protein [Actinomadura terrae]|uniref:amino acid adenylation domain-containing protein n=1 Tax=Actinomadura terrae TaxID=604353 RepID=UPI001FA7F9FE|nr:amino acid adenylation domain-containing protein [Actinomadura terrae]
MSISARPPLVLDRITAAAAARPQAAALVQGEQSLDYRTLLAAARGFATRLREEGVRPGDRVGLHLERSPEAVMAMIATWLAGAAYVPLPVDYPPDRLRYMLDDSGAAHLVTAPGGAAFPHRAKELRVSGAEFAADPAAEMPSAVELPGPAHPDSIAYVIYTSGSSGTPKGVDVTHRGVANLVDPAQTYVRFGAEEVVLQLAPLAFDASAFEIWGALANGARLVLAPATSYRAIDGLPRTLREHGVTTMLLTPALFHAMVTSRPEALDGVRQLVVGGDAMSAERAAEYTRRAEGSGRLLRNAYGPTEASTLVSAHPMEEVAAGTVRLPIGRAIPGARLYLLDAALSPVGPGGTGEIHIGGDVLARGYHGRPELTADRFRPDPFAGEPGGRMFATGDLGELGADGIIRFIGRADNQVKVRGHRVELGEVEAVLEQHPDVTEACVVLAEGALVAHVVTTADLEAVRKTAEAALPSYMAPARYLAHDRLPLGPTGKIDRASLSLSAPEPSAPPDGPAARESVSPHEKTLIEIWEGVLGRPGIRPEDDFFALGGDSISAIGIVGAAEDLGVPLTIELLFGHRTIRNLCVELTAARVAAESTALHATTAWPATRMQLGLIYESLMSSGAHYVDVVSREIDLPFEERALRSAIAFVTGRHELLRARVDLAAVPDPLVVVLPEVSPLLTIGTAASAAELRAPFDVETAPLIRFHAHPLPSGGFRLAYAFHHAVMDGWSESVLALELIQAYAAALESRTLDLPPVPSFAEYARLERQALHDPAVRDLLTGLAGRLPSAGAAHRAGTGTPQLERAIVPAAMLERLRGHGARWKLPMKSLLFAVTGRAVTALRGGDRSLLWMSVSGRPELPSADRMVGLFLNWLPVELRDGPWRRLARAAFDGEAGLLAARRFPFTDLKELVGDVPMEISFNYLRFRLADGLRDLGVRVTRDDVYDRTSLPILVEFHEEDDSLAVDVRADADRYPEGYAAALLAHVLEAIGGLAAEGDVPA